MLAEDTIKTAYSRYFNLTRLYRLSEGCVFHGDFNEISLPYPLSYMTSLSSEIVINFIGIALSLRGYGRQAIYWWSNYMNLCNWSNLSISLSTTILSNYFNGLMLLNILTCSSNIKISYIPLFMIFLRVVFLMKSMSKFNSWF